MDVTRTVLALVAMAVTLWTIGSLFGARDWPTWLLVAFAAVVAVTAARILEAIEQAAAARSRDRADRRERAAAAHEDALRRAGLL